MLRVLVCLVWILAVFIKTMFHFKKKVVDREIKNILFDAFEVTIFIKAIDGILEIIGSFLLLFIVDPVKISNWVIGLTVHELIQDPNDAFANFMLNAASNLSIDSTSFAAIYLMIHGLAKLFIVILLWNKKIWAYPVMIVFLSSFVTYQLYRYTHTHAMTLILLSIFDAITALLTWNAYKQALASRDKKTLD